MLQDGRIAVQGRTEIKIYNPKKNYKCENIINDDAMIAICQIDNGNIISAHENNSLKIRTVDGLFINSIPDAHLNIIKQIEPLSNNRIALSSKNEVIRVWEKKSENFIFYSLSLDSQVVSFCYIRKENILIALSIYRVYIWNGSSYQKITIIVRIAPSYNNIFQLDDKRVIMGGLKLFLVINFIKGTIENEITIGKSESIYGFLKINEEDLFIGTNFHLRIINTKTKKCIKVLPSTIMIKHFIQIKENIFAFCSKYNLFIWKYYINK